jgi:hypothetical protein
MFYFFTLAYDRLCRNAKNILLTAKYFILFSPAYDSLFLFRQSPSLQRSHCGRRRVRNRIRLSRDAVHAAESALFECDAAQVWYLLCNNKQNVLSAKVKSGMMIRS